MTACLCLRHPDASRRISPIELASAPSPFTDAIPVSVAHARALLDRHDEFVDEPRWMGPPPAVWWLLGLGIGTLAPLFLALTLAAQVP